MITNHLFENVILFIKYIGNNKIDDFSNVNWVECYRQSLMSDVFKIADLWNVIAIKSQNRNKKNRLFNKYL